MQKTETRTRKQDNLLALIKRLDTNEKRYFKLFANLQQGGKKYAQLFDEIAGQNRYDAAAICSKYNISAKQLADNKAYLEIILLKALVSFHSGTDYEFRCMNGLMEAEVLASKGLFGYAITHLHKLKKSLIPGEENLHYFMAVSRESNFLRKMSPGNFKADIYVKNNDIISRLEAILVHNKLVKLSVEILDLAANLTYIKNGHIKQKALSLVNQSRKLVNGKKLSSNSYIVYHMLLTNYYLHLGIDTRLAAYHSSVALKKLETESQIFQQFYVNNHYGALSSLIQCNLALRDYETCMKYIRKLQRFAYTKVPPEFSNKAKFSAIKFEIINYTIHGKYEECLTFIQKQLTVIDKLQPTSSNKAIIELLWAINQFHLREYPAALKKIIPLLASGPPVLMPETQAAARALNLMIQYELGNKLSLPYYLEAETRFFKSKKLLSAEVVLFLETVKHLVKTNKTTSLLTFKKKLGALYNKAHFELIGQFVVMPWLEKLIKNKESC